MTPPPIAPLKFFLANKIFFCRKFFFGSLTGCEPKFKAKEDTTIMLLKKTQLLKKKANGQSRRSFAKVDDQ